MKVKATAAVEQDAAGSVSPGDVHSLSDGAGCDVISRNLAQISENQRYRRTIAKLPRCSEEAPEAKGQISDAFGGSGPGGWGAKAWRDASCRWGAQAGVGSG